MPVPFGSKSVTVIRYCMGEFIYAEHPKGCSLQLFYRTSPCRERGFCPFRYGCDSFTVIIRCVGGFVYRNTQRDVPYGCSTVPHPVRNAAFARSVWVGFVYRHNFLCGRVYFRGTPKGMFPTVVLFWYLLMVSLLHLNLTIQLRSFVA